MNNKKYIKKARSLSFEEKREVLKKKGYYFQGKCLKFACPIANNIEFEDISSYENSSDYNDIKSQDEMPWGFGDDLMGIEKELADNLNIQY